MSKQIINEAIEVETDNIRAGINDIRRVVEGTSGVDEILEKLSKIERDYKRGLPDAFNVARDELSKTRMLLHSFLPILETMKQCCERLEQENTEVVKR